MREFFHGGRRKVGCVLLVMACGLLAVDAMISPEPWEFHWAQTDVSLEWRQGIATTSRFSMASMTVPNWAIAIALTFLSAYLILWKPRSQPKELPNA